MINMINRKIDIVNGFIKLILFLVLITFTIMLTYSILVVIIEKEKASAFQFLKEEASAFQLLGAFIVYIGLIFSIKPAFKEVCRYFFPKLYCNEYVKKFINRKELKQILSNETFEKIAIKKSNDDKFDFYASKNWLYIGNAYIPKAMVLGTDYYPKISEIALILLNNKRVLFNNITIKDWSNFLDELKKTKIIPNLYYGKNAIPYGKFEEKYIKKFLNEIKEKEDFLKLIKNDYFFTNLDLKPEFIKDSLKEEKIEYIKGKDGKHYKKYTNPLGETFFYEIDEI